MSKYDDYIADAKKAVSSVSKKLNIYESNVLKCFENIVYCRNQLEDLLSKFKMEVELKDPDSMFDYEDTDYKTSKECYDTYSQLVRLSDAYEDVTYQVKELIDAIDGQAIDILLEKGFNGEQY